MMPSGFQGAQYFRRYRRELVSKPEISLKFGRATGERLTVGLTVLHTEKKMSKKKMTSDAASIDHMKQEPGPLG